MRSLFFAAFMFTATLAAPGTVYAQGPGVEAERVSRASALDTDHGAVIISIRSELYLEEPLDVYFLREGGDINNDADVVKFGRKQGFFSFGNDTTEYKVRAFQLREGTYRLVAHGIDCAKVPAENERCVVDLGGILGTEEVWRPSRGYGEIAPSFEVRAGAITYAGDFALTSRNTVEWSEIPLGELEQVRRRFGGLELGPDPVIPAEYRLKYGLRPRSFEDDYGRRY